MRDETIVALYWERDEEAIHQTERKYGAYLAKVSYNILADLEDSKECVNDTYLAAWNSMPPHKPSVLITYLAKITRQLSVDTFRKKNALKRYASEYALSLDELGDSFPDSTTPEQALDAKLLDEAVISFVRALPETSQNVFVGRYFFFDSLKDLAAYSGMKESRVTSLLYRTIHQPTAHLFTQGLTYL